MWLLRSVQIGRYQCMMVLVNSHVKLLSSVFLVVKTVESHNAFNAINVSHNLTCSVYCTDKRVKSLERETTSTQCQRDIDMRDSEPHFHHRTCPSREQNITLPSPSCASYQYVFWKLNFPHAFYN